MNNSNEVTRTPGEWILIKCKSASNVWTFKNKKGEYIGLFSAEVLRPPLIKYAIEKGKANAAFLCKAVNEYDALKEDNAALLDALKEITDLFLLSPKLSISFKVLNIARKAIQKQKVNKI